MAPYWRYSRNSNQEHSTPSSRTPHTELGWIPADLGNEQLSTITTTTPPTPPAPLSPASLTRDSGFANHEPTCLSSVTLTYSDGLRRRVPVPAGTHSVHLLHGRNQIPKEWPRGEERVSVELRNGYFLLARGKRASSTPPSTSSDTTEWLGTSASTVPRNQLVSSRSYWLHLLYLVILFSILAVVAVLRS